MINTNINTKIKKFFNIGKEAGIAVENKKIDLDEIKAEVSFLRSKRIYIWEKKSENQILMYDSDSTTDSKARSVSIQETIDLAKQEGFVQEDNEPIEPLPKKTGIKDKLHKLRRKLPKKEGTFENDDTEDLMTSIDSLNSQYTNVIAKNQLNRIKQKLQSGKIDQSIVKEEIVELLVATNGYRLPDKAFGIVLNSLNEDNLSLDSVKNAINALPENIPKKHPLKNKLLNGIIQLRPKNILTGYGAELVKNSYNTLTTLGYNLPVKALIVGGDGIKLIAETGLNTITKATELLTKNLPTTTKENLKKNQTCIKLQKALTNIRQFLSRPTNAPQLSQMEVISPDIGAMRTNKEVVMQSLTTLGMATAQAVFLVNSLTFGLEIGSDAFDTVDKAGNKYAQVTNSKLGKSMEGGRMIDKKVSQIVSSKAGKVVGKIADRFDGVGNTINTLFVKGNDPIRATETLVNLYKTGELKTPEAIKEQKDFGTFFNRPVVQTPFEKQEHELTLQGVHHLRFYKNRKVVHR